MRRYLHLCPIINSFRKASKWQPSLLLKRSADVGYGQSPSRDFVIAVKCYLLLRTVQAQMASIVALGEFELLKVFDTSFEDWVRSPFYRLLALFGWFKCFFDIKVPQAKCCLIWWCWFLLFIFLSFVIFIENIDKLFSILFLNNFNLALKLGNFLCHLFAKISNRHIHFLFYFWIYGLFKLIYQALRE